ncbi:ERVV2 protein, partial [Falcunculus frontatus]|nr:ERVV2 protein [Falcunculus frontatus]
TVFHSIIRTLIPSLRIVKLEKAVVNISAIIEHIERQTADAISALQEEVHGLSHVVMQNRMALNVTLAPQGGVCAIINTTCSYVDQSGRI